ncbi:hypothetical protein OROMI_027459 [Orobanche minor]
MVDVDRRMTGLNPSHVAAPLPPRKSLFCFTSLLADKVITHFTESGIHVIKPGPTELEFSVAEAEFRFAFPPDLKAVLSARLPVVPGFPDWRSSGSSPSWSTYISREKKNSSISLIFF